VQHWLLAGGGFKNFTDVRRAGNFASALQWNQNFSNLFFKPANTFQFAFVFSGFRSGATQADIERTSGKSDAVVGCVSAYLTTMT
jgi:hypothetical protein